MAGQAQSLAGKTALVTGAASGIGAASARALSREGAFVVISDIDDKRGQALAADLGEHAVYKHLDVTDPQQWETVLRAVETERNRLDILVHNAGGGSPGTLEETTLDQWRHVQRLNVESVFVGTQVSLPLMRRSGDGGAIVVISSVAGLIGVPDLVAYGAAKAAVRNLSKSIALHCAHAGDKIRCNSIHPGFTDTPMVAALVEHSKNPPKAKARLENAAPLRRLAVADEVASLVVYLAGDGAAFVTGTEIPVDGGLTAQ